MHYKDVYLVTVVTRFNIAKLFGDKVLGWKHTFEKQWMFQLLVNIFLKKTIR